MKIGSYTISDWILSDLTWRSILINVPFNHAQTLEHISVYKKHNNKWVISITSHPIEDCHRQMYNVDMMSLLFNSKEEAK